MITNQPGKKSLNFELNLLPAIDLMAHIICFTMLTTIWIPLGSIDVTQALGENVEQKTENPPSVTATLSSQGDVHLELKNLKEKKGEQKYTIKGRDGRVNLKNLDEGLRNIAQTFPSIQTGLVAPDRGSVYEDVVRIMDGMKKVQINSVGIAPL